MRFPAAALFTLLAMGGLGRGDTAVVIRGESNALVARNFDALSGDGYLFAYPRGVDKVALTTGPGEPLRWTSRYRSVTVSPIGLGFPLGGINEAGLCIQALAGPAGYPAPFARQPVVNELQWVQYHLDRHRSVTDVLKTRGAPGLVRLLFDLHYLVVDRKGNAAVIEFSDGRRIHHAGRNLTELVLTETGYAESLRGLEQRRVTGIGPGVAGDAGPLERFARSSSLLRNLAVPGARSRIDDAFLALNAAAAPDTRWNLVFHLPGQRLFWKTKTGRRFRIVSLEGLALAESSPALMLPVDGEASGGLNDAFVAFDPALNRALLESVFERFHGLRPPAGWTESDVVRRLAESPRY